MSFDILEKLRLIKAKANLYNFLYKGVNYLYTDHDVAIISQNLTYNPIYINRSNIKGSNNAARSEVEVTVGKDNEIAKLFRNFLPSDTIQLIIKECHVNEPDDTINIFFGEVIGCEINEDEATLTSLPINVLLNTKSTRYTYQSLCNHILYKNGCNLNLDDWKFKVEVLNIEDSGTLITLNKTLPDGSSYSSGDYLKAGMIITKLGEYKTILDVNEATNKIKLLTACVNLNVGDLVEVAPGCSRSSSDCKNKFNNFNNYFGFEFVPNRNPFDSL